MRTEGDGLGYWIDRYFYLFMTLLLAAIAVYGPASRSSPSSFYWPSIGVGVPPAMMVIATCTLMFAAFTRFPILPLMGASGWVNGLVLLGVVRDILVDHRIDRIYVYSLALLLCCQLLEREIRVHALHWWTHVCIGRFALILPRDAAEW